MCNMAYFERIVHHLRGLPPTFVLFNRDKHIRVYLSDDERFVWNIPCYTKQILLSISNRDLYLVITRCCVTAVNRELKIRRRQTWSKGSGERLPLQWRENSIKIRVRRRAFEEAVSEKIVNCCSWVTMMETFHKMNFYCCMMLTAQKILIFPTKITNILTWKNSTKVSVWQNFVFEKGTYLFSQRQWGCLTLIHVNKGLYVTELKAFVFS